MKRFLLASVAMLTTMAPVAHAEPLSMEQMQRQIEALSQQVKELSSVVKEQNKLINAQQSRIETQEKISAVQQSALIEKEVSKRLTEITPAAGDAKASSSGVNITMDPSPKIESADGKFSFQPFGRLHFDVTTFQDDKSDQPDNAHVRRARLGFKGNLGEDFDYKAEIDFAGDATNLKEVYLNYTGMESMDLILGNFKPPSGLEQNTSTNYMEFVELAPVSSAFTRDEILGVALRSGGENWSLAGGIFNEDPGINSADDESRSVDVRGSYALLNGTDVFHAGASASLRKPNATGGNVTLSSKPAGTGTSLITTGAMNNADSISVYGAELAGVFGPFSLQSEYLRYNLDRDAGASDPSFDGWYVQGSYFLTGESRPYKGKIGNFDRVKPKRPFSLREGGLGAWEILTRYDVLDLNDSGAGIMGGRMEDWTVGLNWYLNNNVRLMFNYVDVRTDSDAVIAGDDPKVATLRAQVDF